MEYVGANTAAQALGRGYMPQQMPISGPTQSGVSALQMSAPLPPPDTLPMLGRLIEQAIERAVAMDHRVGQLMEHLGGPRTALSPENATSGQGGGLVAVLCERVMVLLTLQAEAAEKMASIESVVAP